MEIQHILDEEVPLLSPLFQEKKLPTTIDDLEDGALLPGGALDFTSPEALGLFVQFAAIGFVFTLIPALNYPIFNAYLQMEGYQTSAYSVLVYMGLSFKLVYGMLSDCFPICGYRRKSWILIGWTIALVCLAMMAFVLPLGAPFCDRSKTPYCHTPLARVPASALPYFNLRAPDQGALFILLSMFVSMGYVIAECAVDAMIVQFGQREPLASRGRLQTTATAVRYLSGLPALLLVAFGLNGTQYNGSFSFALAPNVPYVVALVPCVVAIVGCLVWVHEDRRHAADAAPSLSAWSTSLWTLLQKQAMWQICAVKFTHGLLVAVAATPLNPIKTMWAGVEPMTNSLMSLLGTACFGGALLIVARHGLHWDWRWTLVATNVAVLAMDATVILATTWDVYRNQWFFACVTMFEFIPTNIALVVGSLFTVEMADVGTEGTVFGLLASMANLTFPLSSVVYNYVDSFFDVTQDAIKADTLAVRWDVTTVYLFSYGCKLAALVPLIWLPAQKPQLQVLKRNGVTSPVAGALVLIVIVASLVLSTSSNLMAVFPATKCFRIAGGNGMTQPSGWCAT
ncbi:Aste57867_13154 [Aphanomyces stellatus]|uniref:Aste57867_13154 protein n=1 Tax=Aphanomyces stellatus TaxID=120398 RepID=A0A485KXD9_9STRA|nr:hypothetical protein As57867_013105 [Aphanomyces stellatus]VFT89995.1 Aste57867_13154 [Aphanomyces stellatus]